jgi:hypothetical protein
MADATAIATLDERIAIVRTNLRELIEQASAFSGAASEEVAAERIAQQEAQLAALLAEREELSKS